MVDFETERLSNESVLLVFWFVIHHRRILEVLCWMVIVADAACKVGFVFDAYPGVNVLG